MHRASIAALLVAGTCIGAGSSAAENFDCGPGGAPDAKTAKCTCPKGKVESSTNGTSRCVDAPMAQPKPKPKAKPLPTCAPSQIPTPSGCVERCAPDETWNGSTCEAPAKTTTTAPTCTDGKVLDPTGHCCFEGQVWVEGAERCRGKPKCPSGFDANGESCVVRCAAGMTPVSEGLRCCWPGQDWSGAISKCVGVPECAAGFHPNDAEDACVVDAASGANDDSSPADASSMTAPDAPLEPKRLFAADASDETWGPFRFEMGLGAGYLRAHDAFDVLVYGYTSALHFRDLPILVRASVFGGQFNYACETGPSCKGRFATAVGGVALAPFSKPALGSGAWSWLNPFIGADVAYAQWTGETDTKPAPNGVAILGVVGNSFFSDARDLPAFGLTVLVERAFVGNEARADLLTTINGSVTLF